MFTAAGGNSSDPEPSSALLLADNPSSPDTGLTRALAWGLSGADLLVLGLVALLCVATLPMVGWLYWTPRTALLLIALGPGLMLLALRACQRDRAAITAAAVGAWFCLSATLAPSPRSASIGDMGSDRNLLTLVAIIGCWGLGTQLSTRGLSVLPRVLLTSLAISGGIGALQAVGLLGGSLGSRFDGRASGLTDSPVYFGPLMAGGAALSIALIPQVRRWWILAPLTTFFAMSVNLSGTRIAVAALVVGAVAAARHVHGIFRLAAVGSLLLGLLIGGLMPGAVSADSRVRGDINASTPFSGITPRFEAWKAAGQAILDRPIVGHGPGQFAAATTKNLSVEFARAEGPDRVFIDAHNILIEHATTAGVLGAVLLILFAWTLAVRARGPLAIFGLTVAISWLLEPVSLHTAPVVLVALAAADRAIVSPIVLPRVVRATAVGVSCLGLAAATALVIGDRALHRVFSSGSLEDLADAERWLPTYPFLSDIRTTLLIERAVLTGDRQLEFAAIESARRTVELNSDHWQSWVRLGEIVGTLGDDAEAERYFRDALKRYPWSEGAWRGVAIAGVRLGDQAIVTEANDRLCQLRSQFCDQIKFRAE